MNNNHEETWQKIKDRKKLLSSDDIGFKRIQVTNDIFGLKFSEGYLQWGKSSFKISQNESIWFPHLTPNKDWKNTFNGNIFYEEYIGNDKEKIERIKNLKPGESHKKELEKNKSLYTFAKCENKFGEISYKFIGVFNFKENKNSIFIYEKISDELNLG